MNSNRRLRLVSAGVLVSVLVAGRLEGQQPGWSETGSLSTGRRWGHSATLLLNGKVLVAGGNGIVDSGPRTCCEGISSAELYDPATGQWSPTGSLATPRNAHFAVRLPDGKVLVAGGGNGYRGRATTVEIYDPETGSWSEAGTLDGVSSVTLLADGRLLVMGVVPKLYNPATGEWSDAGRPNFQLGGSATLLSDGRVLFAGGSSKAEIYEPSTGRWTVTRDLKLEHLWAYNAILLPSGKVLLVGGGISGDDGCIGLNSSELYDPRTGQWSVTGSPIETHYDYNLRLLPNGKVLLAAGASPGCHALNHAEVYDPATEQWTATESLVHARIGHSTTLLANGKVLVAGGFDGIDDSPANPLLPKSAEIFDGGLPILTSVSGAGFSTGGMLAPESIASGFGINLVTSPQVASSFSMPLPTELAGVRVSVRDGAGIERLAPIFFVSPGQINYQIPPGTAFGKAAVTVTNGGIIVAVGAVEIARVAPGLFSVNAGDSLLAAAQILRRKADGTEQYEFAAYFDSAQNKYVARPIDLGSATDQVFLHLYGTGIRFRSGLAAVTATIGGTGVEVLYADVAPGLLGVDQISVRLPRSLEGRGQVEVTLSVEGKAANPVRINIR